MAYASVTYTSASGTTFALTNGSGDPIPYLKQADIKVYVNDVLKTLTTDYTFNTAGTAIVLNTAVSGVTVRLERTTDIAAATVVYTAGSTLTAQDLNNADNQIRYGLQEFSDTYAALNSGTGDLGNLGGIVDSNESWASDDSHLATTVALDSRIDTKIETALTGDIVAGTDLSIADNVPGSGQITISHNVAGAGTTVNNSNGVVLQDITVTSQGHVTSVGSYDLDNRYYTEAETDAKYVALTGAQTIAGVKTFSSSPVGPTPTNSTDLATKGYVDGVAISGIADGDKGDIIVGSSGTSWTIDTGVVTNSKIATGTITDSAINAAAGITGTKIQQGSTSVRGTVQLTDSVSDISTTTAATPNSVKTAYDLADTANTTANAALPKAGGTMTGDITFNGTQTFPASGIQDGTTTQKGLVQLTNSTSSTSTTTAATPNSVKTANDTANTALSNAATAQSTANAAMPKSGGTFTGDIIVPSLNGGPLAGARNRIINGDMRIDQRNAGASVTPNLLAYPVDRTFGFGSVTGKFSCQQNSGSVTPPSGFTNYIGAVSLSAYSVPSGEQYIFGQPIEGLNVADLGWGAAGAQSVTLSFWVRSSLTGTFGGALQNSAFDRSYPFSYTIGAANTWEQKAITIPGDTSGTWLKTNGVGIRLGFSLGAGSTMSGTAGAWAGANYVSATGATSVVGTNGATWMLTGVQLEAGSIATPFERRSYGQELALCQRYYFALPATIGGAVNPTGSAAQVSTSVQWPVFMRATPTTAATGGQAINQIFKSTQTQCSILQTVNNGDIANIQTLTASAEL